MKERVFQSRPLAICCLAVRERVSFPCQRALYFVFSGEQLLYIGATTDLKQRWLSHHRMDQFIEAGNPRVAWIVIPRRWDLEYVERWAIDQFQPTLNRIYSPSPYMVTVKILPETHQKLKYLAAISENKFYAVAEQLASAEMQRLGLSLPTLRPIRPVEITITRCLYCGYKFQPRVALPPRCNNCKRRWPISRPKGSK